MGFHCSRGVRHGAALALVALSWSSVVGAQVVVRGVLYDDASGAPVSGAVMLIDPRTDAPVVHATTDSVGAFTLQAGEGVYQIGAVRPGWVTVLSAPMGLQSGERLTIRVPIAQNGDPRASHRRHRARSSEGPEWVAGARRRHVAHVGLRQPAGAWGWGSTMTGSSCRRTPTGPSAISCGLFRG